MSHTSVWPVGELRLSGTDTLPASAPRATIMALHGGGYSAGYWRDLFYGPDGTFDPDMIAAEERLIRPIPAAEIIDAVECPQSTPALAPKITVPVQVTRADFDASSGGGRQGLERCGGLFTSSPGVVLAWQRASGHNISLHRVARAYHLRAVAFFDEVLAGAQQPPVT